MVKKTKRMVLATDEDKVFGGVCAGVADYFDVDPVWIRVPLFLFIWVYGVGLLVYFAFWLSMPYPKEL